MKEISSYIFGFTLSLALTAAAFWLVELHIQSGHTWPSHAAGIGALTILATIQLIVQLVLFLHVGREEKPRFNLYALLMTALIVTILVGGSLWIMNNLMHMQEHGQIPFTGQGVSPQSEDD